MSFGEKFERSDRPLSEVVMLERSCESAKQNKSPSGERSSLSKEATAALRKPLFVFKQRLPNGNGGLAPGYMDDALSRWNEGVLRRHAMAAAAKGGTTVDEAVFLLRKALLKKLVP